MTRASTPFGMPCLPAEGLPFSRKGMKPAGIFVLWMAACLFPSGERTACAQESTFMENRWVAILSVYSGFAEARADAEKIAKAGGVPFSMEGRVFDKKRGLIYPDNLDDPAFAGSYVARRDNLTNTLKGDPDGYLSVERSDGYDGFKAGYYIVVAGIYGSSAEAEKQAGRFRKWAPTAYVKKTKIYMGCLH